MIRVIIFVFVSCSSYGVCFVIILVCDSCSVLQLLCGSCDPCRLIRVVCGSRVVLCNVCDSRDHVCV